MSLPKSRPVIRNLIILSTLAILLTIVVVKIAYVNSSAPNIPRVEHSVGDEIDGDNLSLSVTKFKVYDVNHIEKIAPGYTSLFRDSDNPNNPKLIVVDVKVTNRNTERLLFDISSISLQSGAWSNGVSLMLLDSLNEESAKELRAFDGNTSKTIQLPFELVGTQFKNSTDWELVPQRDYDLVLSVYPAYHFVHLGSPKDWRAL